MSTPEERVEMFLDAQGQTDDWAREQRAEYRDAGDYEPADRPSKAELAEMAYWDRIDDKREGRR